MSTSRLRVLALAPYPEEAPSTRVRLSQYRDPLDLEGIDLSIRPFLSSEAYRLLKSSRRPADRGGVVVAALSDISATLRRASDYDVVWVQRGVAPLLDPWALDALRAARVPLVYDFDDAVYLPQAGGRAWVEGLRNARGVTEAFCRAAAVVFAGNADLADFARNAVGDANSDRVHVVPSVVDTARLAPRPSGGSTGIRDRTGPAVVGWIGTDTTVRYLESLQGPLAELSAAGTCRFIVIAGRRRPRLPGVDFTFVPWSQEAEPDLVRSLDIGLYPLDDTPWSRGKCGFKAVQYMASGVPCVASPVGVLRELVRPGVTGLWADTPEAWVSAIGEIARDRAARERMAKAGRALVEAGYSLRSCTPIVAELLVAAANRGSES